MQFEPLEERQLLAVTWTGEGDGKSWDDATNWSGHALPTSNDDVIIDMSTFDPVIEIKSGNDISIRSLTSSETIVMTGGMLDVSGAALFKQDFTLQSGTLKNGVWNTGENTTITSDTTFSGVTVGGEMNVTGTLTVVDGVTINGVVTVYNYGRVYFKGIQTFDGTGALATNSEGTYYPEIWVQGTIEQPSILTIAESATIRSGGSSGTSLVTENGSFVNHGTISATDGTLTLTNAVVIGGTINATLGILASETTTLQNVFMTLAAGIATSGNLSLVNCVITGSVSDGISNSGTLTLVNWYGREQQPLWCL